MGQAQVPAWVQVQVQVQGWVWVRALEQAWEPVPSQDRARVRPRARLGRAPPQARRPCRPHCHHRRRTKPTPRKPPVRRFPTRGLLCFCQPFFVLHSRDRPRTSSASSNEEPAAQGTVPFSIRWHGRRSVSNGKQPGGHKTVFQDDRPPAAADAWGRRRGRCTRLLQRPARFMSKRARMLALTVSTPITRTNMPSKTVMACAC